MADEAGTTVAVAGKGRAVRTATPKARTSLIEKFAARYSVDGDKLLATLKATAFHSKGEVTNEQMLALLVVADQYKLNPFTKELYAFPDSNRGGIVPVVSVDGWLRIINERPELESIEFEYGGGDDDDDPWIACTISRKDRGKPVTVREYMNECRRDTGPWKSHPRRMLRHKVLIQCARVAFGFAGIYDPDEAERVANAIAIPSTAIDVTGKSVGHVAQPEPEGYSAWEDNLRACADEGPSVLAETFGKGDANFRSYLTVERTHVWNALKAKAERASQAEG